MVMVSDNIKIDLQGITKMYLQIKSRRDDYLGHLKQL